MGTRGQEEKEECGDWGTGRKVRVGDKRTGREVRVWAQEDRKRSKSVGTRGQEEK